MTRRLTPEERRLWSRVARTVRPAQGKTVEVVPEYAALAGPSKGEPASGQRKPSSRAPISRLRPGPPEDLSGQRRIRRGQTEIDALLDLHGATQDSARRAFLAFVGREHARGSRRLLIITGKGRSGSGVLRARLADWIADPELRPMLAGFARAHRRHGGDGAVYVFLKAKKR
jgi:DNA-nicking Smr family endonuclease